MTPATVWQAAESCPDCGGALTLLDDGTATGRLDCGSCGYAETVAITDPAGGDK
jgi:ribosomal protein S27AE